MLLPSKKSLTLMLTGWMRSSFWPIKAVLWFPIKEVSVGKVKRYLGRKPGGGRLQCCFTAPLRLLSPSPFPALLFSLPWGTKQTRMQQPFWDSMLLNCADCEEVACKQDQSNQGLYSGLSSTPTHWPEKTASISTPTYTSIRRHKSGSEMCLFLDL